MRRLVIILYWINIWKTPTLSLIYLINVSVTCLSTYIEANVAANEAKLSNAIRILSTIIMPHG